MPNTIGLHPFITCVGRENEPDRIRRTTFPYDTAYGEPLPVIDLEFRRVSGVTGLTLDRVIPDTGADASTLPWVDCQSLRLDPAVGVFGFITGVGGGSQNTLVFNAWVFLDGQEYECRLPFSSSERILGRDVLNQIDVLFRGPANEVVVNP